MNIVMMCPNQTGSHLILLWTNPNIHAHTKNAISNFFTFTFDAANKYAIGIRAHNIADMKIRRFWLEPNIQK